ncbi:amino-acid transporter arg-13 [Patellaria atrata CBS 101060]|uniref:Amino-acid transporter arg-13 n=1 Tax=Patellaria atrata CBS 101060 TaxID=1346257 RepID=A0A9P4S572_9PEZI|nr:amino-acid transporter arg-13 [Patellaria atrata CBS 101060]
MSFTAPATTLHDRADLIPHAVASLEEQEAIANIGENALKDIAFGSIAGIGGKFLEYPFDTVKVRLQTQPSHLPPLYKGGVDCLVQSFRKDGLYGGLYRGISAPLAGAAAENACLFFGKRFAQNILYATPYTPTLYPISTSFFSGAVSGAFTSFVLTPIELLKCKVQVPVVTASGALREQGWIALTKTIYQHGGLAGFYRGHSGTFIRESIGGAFWFGMNDLMLLKFKERRAAKGLDATTVPITSQMIAGATGGISFTVISYPADTIKSRLQTEDVKGLTAGRQTFLGSGIELWKQQGIRGMFRGCGITMFRSAISSATIFTIYQVLVDHF